MEAGREGERREADGRDARHKMTGGEGMVAVQGFWRLGDWMGIVIWRDKRQRGHEGWRRRGVLNPEVSVFVFVNGHASIPWFMFESMFFILAFCFDGCPTMQSQNGNTALDLARSEGKDEVVKLLEAAAEKKKAAAPARGDPDEPRDEVSLHASTCAIKWQAAG